MPRRLLAVLFAASALALPASAHADVAGHLRYSISAPSQWPDAAASAERQSYVILHAWEISRLNQLKQANPSLRVLLYKDLSAINSFPRENGYQSTGVAWDEADTANPEWYLKNTSGQRFQFSGYYWLWAADVGNAAYQQRWGDNVAAELAAQPWDGVFIDDTNPTIRYHYEVSQVAKYPTDAAYQAATRSMLASISPKLRRNGKIAIANMGSWVGYNAVVSDWMQFVDGAMDETFTKWSDQAGANYRDTAEWERQLAEVKELEAQGKVFLGVTQSANSDRTAARYGFASMLLGAEGRAAFQMGSDYAHETWFPEYDYELGNPLGSETRGADGVHRRAFASGLVIVNPTATSRVVSFGGRYSGSGLTDAVSATLPSHTGLILTSEPSSVEPDPAAVDPLPLPIPVPLPPIPSADRLASTAASGNGSATHVRVRVSCRRPARGRSCRGPVVLRSKATGSRSLGRRLLVLERGRSVVLRVPLNSAGRRLVRTAGVGKVRAVARGVSGSLRVSTLR